MVMFSHDFDSIWREVSAQPDPPLDSAEFGAGGPADAALLAEAREAKASRFGNVVRAVSPLYVSSICKELCTYCNYRAGSTDPNLKRVRLSEDALRREVEFLVASRGLRAVELVYASDPLIGCAEICRHVEITRGVLEEHGGGRVGLSAEPMSVDEYRRLRDAGVSFSVVWQETYDPVRYAELHPGKQVKSDFGFRLGCFERMIEAGIEDVGIGVLSGLADWRRDWSMLMRHEEWLWAECGKGATILGLPRLRPAPGAAYHESTFIPTDGQFKALLALHNVRFPKVRPFISTRERFEMCVELAAGGGCLFTLNCSTVPGGYTMPNRGAQFSTGNYDALEFAPKVREAGYGIEWQWGTGAMRDEASSCYTNEV